MINFEVAGLKINALTKIDLLDDLKNRILRQSAFAKASSDKSANNPLLNKNNVGQTWVTTVYSEFLYAALKDPKIMNMLNEADIALPDGIGIFWAHKFLSQPLTAKSYFGKIIQSLWQVKYSLTAILFNKKWIYNLSAPSDALRGASPQEERKLQAAVAPPLLRGGAGERLQEKIPGSELIWDISKLAAENNLSIYLLGGFDDTAKLTANKLKSQSANKLKIAGYSNKNPTDKTIIEDINKSGADILFVAYGPIKQEEWIYKHKNQLPTVKLFIGLGGTFDYIAGKKLNPPKFVRALGLEWLFRLITQPYRIKRIYNATFGLIKLLVKYKFFKTFPLRPNVAIVIKNLTNEILICQRQPVISKFYSEKNTLKNRFDNYWQFPQGGIDNNEDIVKAAEREALEETGLKNLKFIRLSKKFHSYEWNNAIRKINLSRKLLYRGQLQHVAYFKYFGNPEDVKVDQKEFINFKWLPPAALLNTIHEERAGLTKIVLEDLSLF